MKPDEKPPSTREEAETRLRDNQAKRDALQKEIDAHEKTMKDAAGKMKDMMLRQKALDEKLRCFPAKRTPPGRSGIRNGERRKQRIKRVIRLKRRCTRRS